MCNITSVQQFTSSFTTFLVLRFHMVMGHMSKIRWVTTKGLPYTDGKGLHTDLNCLNGTKSVTIY